MKVETRAEREKNKIIMDTVAVTLSNFVTLMFSSVELKIKRSSVVIYALTSKPLTFSNKFGIAVLIAETNVGLYSFR